MDGDEDKDLDPALIDEFLARHRRGEPITVAAFAALHPAAEAQLRAILPTLVALEGAKRERASSGSSGKRVSLPKLERLGDFRLVGELGRGGMGVVFEAVQESLGRKVALKVLPQASLLTKNQLERFRREAQIAAQLYHSNIVPVFGSGESDGYHWYAMQFIGGQSLEHWRRDQAAAPPQGSGAWRSRARFVARLGAQAASALAYAHAQGTLHRDIKPGNLLLEDNDHLWITDFGLAKALEAEGLTHSGDLLGTLQYMAPEQFAGHYDQRSEVYALGVTLYELLVLGAAFVGKSRSELMERIRSQPPESLRRRCPELPEDLVVVVEKAMARDPADRYADAEQLEHDLVAFLEDRPIAARRHGQLALLRRWCRRNKLVAALALSTLLAVVVAGVTGWVAFGATKAALGEASAQSARAERTLRRTLDAFGEVFDALLGPDPVLSVDEDPDSGEQTLLLRSTAAPRDVDLLQQMLAFYNAFAAENADNQALRYETARAYRRLGTIRARLGRPEQFDAAAADFAQALARLAAITDRDVRREQAAVQIAWGQLEQRRGGFEVAGEHFRAALPLLEALPKENRSVRFELAQVRFFLAQTIVVRGGGRGRDGDPARREARDQARQALALIEGLLQEEPKNAEFRLFKARCLLRSGAPAGAGPRGVAGGGQGAGRPDNEGPFVQRRQELQDEALAMLRELVVEVPSTEVRFELSQALLRAAVPMARGGEPDGELLREARDQAELLVKAEPEVEEYVLLRAEVGVLLGRTLLAKANALPVGHGEIEALRREGQLEFAAAALHGRAGLDLVQARLGAGGVRPGDERLRPLLDRLVQATNDADLRARAKAMRETLPRPDLRPERPPERPPERRNR
ncbi:MAG: serine/threonine protein kinase [Planctomycetes bacterium]|nr:serine/threonine protein kinase [Planctomycetota bacterium]